MVRGFFSKFFPHEKNNLFAADAISRHSFENCILFSSSIFVITPSEIKTIFYVNKWYIYLAIHNLNIHNNKMIAIKNKRVKDTQSLLFFTFLLCCKIVKQ